MTWDNGEARHYLTPEDVEFLGHQNLFIFANEPGIGPYLTSSQIALHRSKGLKMPWDERTSAPLKSGDSVDRMRITDLEKYLMESIACQQIFGQRNRVYGGAFREVGVLGAVVEILGDMARVRELVMKNADHGRSHEKEVEDKLRDVINFGLIALMMIREDNWHGSNS